MAAAVAVGAGSSAAFATPLASSATPSGPVGATRHYVEYTAHVQNIGWQPYQADNTVAGTTGRSLQIEDLKIRPGALAPAGASVCYSVIQAYTGMLKSACNDGEAGVTGQGIALENVQIRLVNAPAGWHVCYSPHVQNIGWMPEVCDNSWTGSPSGQHLHLEALKVRLVKPTVEVSKVDTRQTDQGAWHIASNAWLTAVYDGMSNALVDGYLSGDTTEWSDSPFGFHGFITGGVPVPGVSAPINNTTLRLGVDGLTSNYAGWQDLHLPLSQFTTAWKGSGQEQNLLITQQFG